VPVRHDSHDLVEVQQFAEVDGGVAADGLEKAVHRYCDVLPGLAGEQNRFVDVHGAGRVRQDCGGVHDEGDGPAGAGMAHAALRRRVAATSRTTRSSASRDSRVIAATRARTAR
jgi:hypothetical protein